MKMNTSVGSVKIKIDTDRVNDAVLEAQKALNEQIVADCTPLIPFRQGALREQVRFPDGVYGGQIEWYAPYAHYQYAGEVYGPNIPVKDAAGNITGWFSPPKKYPTGRRLQYNEPGTGSEWFEKSKSANLQKWVDLVKKKIGGK